MQQQQIHPSESTAHGDVSQTTGRYGSSAPSWPQHPPGSTGSHHPSQQKRPISVVWPPQVHHSAPQQVCPHPSPTVHPSPGPTASPPGPQALSVKHPRRAAEPGMPQDNTSPACGGCHAEHSHSSYTQATRTTIFCGSPGIQSFLLLYQAKDFPLDKPSFSHVTKFPKPGFLLSLMRMTQ